MCVMGSSGAGKDTMMEIAGKRLAGFGGIKLARRYITRPTDAGGENFTSISPEAFNCLEAKGHFLFSWRSHGLSYGIDRQAERFFKNGFTVVINGSRAYLPKALKLCPTLKPVLITAESEILAARLKNRGRESLAEQAERLSQPDYDYQGVRNLHIIDNSGELEIAAEKFCTFLSEELKSAM